MKTLVFSLVLIPSLLMAQRRPGGAVAVRATRPGSAIVPGSAANGTQTPAGALGGGFLSPAFSRPLGGITPAKTPVVSNGKRTSRYVGPIYYVPNAFDTFSSYASEGVAAARAETHSDSSAPVIVNQYFGSRESDYARSEFNSAATRPAADEPAAPGDPIGPAQNYYLISYKDHSIYSALAYWVEDGTLHYVTTQNTHNQASLGLIDLEQTTKLNADHAVPFSIVGK